MLVAWTWIIEPEQKDLTLDFEPVLTPQNFI